MKSKKIIVAALVAVAAIVLAGCSPRSSMATLSTDSDSETAEVFSLAKVLNLGTNYLTSLDYDNAILQYIDIIQHDPTNKEAYAGLYAAYAAQGKADEANKVCHLSRVNAQKSKNIFYEARMRAISSRKSCSEHR